MLSGEQRGAQELLPLGLGKNLIGTPALDWQPAQRGADALGREIRQQTHQRTMDKKLAQRRQSDVDRGWRQRRQRVRRRVSRFFAGVAAASAGWEDIRGPRRIERRSARIAA